MEENQIISTIKQKFQKSMEKKEKNDKRKTQAIENHQKYLKQTEFAHVSVELMEQGKDLTIENLIAMIEEKNKIIKNLRENSHRILLELIRATNDQTA